MRVCVPADYLTLHEVRERWKLPADSLDVHRAVLKGILRPSLFCSGELAMALPGGPLQAGERVPVVGFVYVQCLRQTDAFDCEVAAVSRERDPVDDGALFLLGQPLAMADLFAQAVVMAEDVEAAEQQLAANGQELGAKERGSLLRLISIMLADGYRYDPERRSAVAAEICTAGAGMGLGISEGTALKFLRMAVAEYPPERVPSAFAPRAAQLPHA
ncbi:hypothetical protein [Pseudorhodoferax sp.]|uniref:hypothetical protein n=1 Tax=Pseudorhodoferax sp. TaxID=1993553 RepID=UPI002DD694AB|nr:hypothetical protein [Pseudorhodoferax sp.]